MNERRSRGRADWQLAPRPQSESVRRRTRAVAVSTQPAGYAHGGHCTPLPPGARREPSPAAKPVLCVASTSAAPKARSPLTWSPSARWAAARSRVEWQPSRSRRNSSPATTTSGAESPGSRLCGAHFRSSLLKLCEAKSWGLSQGRGRTHFTSKAGKLRCEVKTGRQQGRRRVQAPLPPNGETAPFSRLWPVHFGMEGRNNQQICIPIKVRP